MLNYAWKPHTTTRQDLHDLWLARDTGDTDKSKIEAATEGYVNHIIDDQSSFKINDVAYLAIYSGLRHTTNRDTLGLAGDRIPQDNTLDQTVSFLIAFLHERNIGMPPLIDVIKESIQLKPGTNRYVVTAHRPITNALDAWTARADKIVELMQTARSIVGHFAADAEFMRDWAMVDLGEVTGLEVATGQNPVLLGFIRHNNIVSNRMASSGSTKLIKLKGLWQPPASRQYRYYGTDTVTVTAKNGPSQIRTKGVGGTWSNWMVLAKDASRTFTKAEMKYDIESLPILAPTALQELPDLTLAVGVTESVDLQGLFQGLNLVISAVTADSGKSTVQINRTQTSMGVSGIAAGTSKITVTGTNEGGSTTVEFTVTVTEGA